ncbi:MAG: hypothetical protein WBZ36_17345 [Candidatus Nitrosopolaris sp.]
MPIIKGITINPIAIAFLLFGRCGGLRSAPSASIENGTIITNATAAVNAL